jgi:hypothetical protein
MELTWTLIPVSVVYGITAAIVFRQFVDEKLLRRTVNRMMAHAMEFRLFLDSLTVVLGAQRDLILENLRLLRLVFLPCSILAVLLVVLFPQLDAMYGHAPLRTGERSIVTAQLSGSAHPVLEAPQGIAIETPAVRTVYDRQINWRVRPLGTASGDLKLRYDDHIITKRIVAGSGYIYEWKLPFSRPAIEIRYPRKTVLGVNWMVWFFLISSAVAAGCSR